MQSLADRRRSLASTTLAQQKPDMAPKIPPHMAQDAARSGAAAAAAAAASGAAAGGDRTAAPGKGAAGAAAGGNRSASASKSSGGGGGGSKPKGNKGSGKEQKKGGTGKAGEKKAKPKSSKAKPKSDKAKAGGSGAAGDKTKAEKKTDKPKEEGKKAPAQKKGGSKGVGQAAAKNTGKKKSPTSKKTPVSSGLFEVSLSAVVGGVQFLIHGTRQSARPMRLAALIRSEPVWKVLVVAAAVAAQAVQQCEMAAAAQHRRLLPVALGVLLHLVPPSAAQHRHPLHLPVVRGCTLEGLSP